MHDLIAALFSFLLVEPLQGELDRYLTEAKVPVALISQVKDCAQTAAPAIIERATNDPGWAVTSIFNVWYGSAHPEKVLIEAAPNCTTAVEAVRPFLTGTPV
jgi:hypothetical protein